MKQMIIATKNAGKATEFKDFFADYHVKALSLLDMPGEMKDIDETGTTFEENAALKAEGIGDLLNKPVLADDSGLEIDALNGQPGIYSARYAGEEKNDKANVEKILYELKDVPMDKRTARFVCVLAIAIPHEETIFRKGFCEGKIALSPEGANGFGYDPVFIPKGYTKTMAQLPKHEKNVISHRSHAINQLDVWIKEYMK